VYQGRSNNQVKDEDNGEEEWSRINLKFPVLDITEDGRLTYYNGYCF
jgi:hypothetical protein